MKRGPYIPREKSLQLIEEASIETARAERSFPTPKAVLATINAGRETPVTDGFLHGALAGIKFPDYLKDVVRIFPAVVLPDGTVCSPQPRFPRNGITIAELATGKPELSEAKVAPNYIGFDPTIIDSGTLARLIHAASAELLRRQQEPLVN